MTSVGRRAARAPTRSPSRRATVGTSDDERDERRSVAPTRLGASRDERERRRSARRGAAPAAEDPGDHGDRAEAGEHALREDDVRRRTRAELRSTSAIAALREREAGEDGDTEERERRSRRRLREREPIATGERAAMSGGEDRDRRDEQRRRDRRGLAAGPRGRAPGSGRCRRARARRGRAASRRADGRPGAPDARCASDEHERAAEDPHHRERWRRDAERGPIASLPSTASDANASWTRTSAAWTLRARRPPSAGG